MRREGFQRKRGGESAGGAITRAGWKPSLRRGKPALQKDDSCSLLADHYSLAAGRVTSPWLITDYRLLITALPAKSI